MTTVDRAVASETAQPCAITTKEELRQHISTLIKARDHALHHRITAAITTPAPPPADSPAEPPSPLWSATEIIDTVLAFDARYGVAARLQRALEDRGQ
ncbi:hypothetical protein [Mycobacteroides abscessus]|uniref:hypothetical protein n=1 Tax=Mycobacteroides abscessus TaxID=36809 RepID=UPI0013001668|nr:hypothetical protein [Mycobacteroides abscessus]